jgi:hypothetical protein
LPTTDFSGGSFFAERGAVAPRPFCFLVAMGVPSRLMYAPDLVLAVSTVRNRTESYFYYEGR